MAMKTLFPPIVPSKLPAFDSTNSFRYFFKQSSANTMSQIEHLQMTLVRMDTNRSVLNPKEYPLDIIFKNKSEFSFDDKTGYYYIDINSNIFPEADAVYKVQIRFGEDNISSINKPEDLGSWLRDPKTLNRLSEWSIVTYAMPIKKPDFGVQSFELNKINKIDSTGYVFTGYYEAKDKNKAENLVSYVFNLYSYVSKNDKRTWKLLSSSGEKKIGVYEKINISHLFSHELLENTKYLVSLSIKTKNLYTETKVYEVATDLYPVIEMFNTIDIEPNIEEAKMDIIVRARQVLLKPGKGTSVQFIVDEPGHEVEPNIQGTHAIINGSVYNSEDFIMSASGGVWICQFKAMFKDVWNSADDAISNAIIVLEDYAPYTDWSDYLTRVSVGAMKIDLAYPTSGNLNPSPEYEYRFVVRKEIMAKSNGVLKTILTQNKIIRQPLIEKQQEYYFYIKESNGLLEVDIKKTYKSKKEFKGGL